MNWVTRPADDGNVGYADQRRRSARCSSPQRNVGHHLAASPRQLSSGLQPFMGIAANACTNKERPNRTTIVLSAKKYLHPGRRVRHVSGRIQPTRTAGVCATPGCA